MLYLALALVVGLIIGMPISFALGGSTVVYCLVNGFPKLAIISQRMVEGVDSFPLMALPLFILSGEIMAYGSTPRLMRLAHMLVGNIPGGLGATATVGCGLFGSISGSAVATAAAIGGVISPEMVKSGYSKSFTVSIVAGAGVLGMIIPPSFCMVLYCAASGYVSIEGMFIAGVVPGVLSIFLLLLYSIWMGKRRGYRSAQRNYGDIKEKLSVIIDAIPPLFMPVIILGGVLTGMVTPTESASVAAIYAFILAFALYREINAQTLVKICTRSAVTSAIVMLIIAMGGPFGWILASQGVPKLLADNVMSISTNLYVIVVGITIALLIMGTFMEGNSLIVLLTPIILPLIAGLGMDPIQFGMVFMMAIAVGGVTPPVAMTLFVSAGIVGIQIEETFPEILHVVAILVFVTFLCIFVPHISLWLPSLFGKALF